MNVLSATGLSKSYGGVRAVDGVELAVGEGQVVGLLGPNGAGKTTLLRMLLGLVRPDSGAIQLFGTTYRESDAVVLDGVSGFVENPSFYPYLSGRANLELLAELDGGGSRSRIEDVLDQVGLARREGDRVGGYSSGMRQRLGIAAALLRAPDLLLLDEPTAGLDPAGIRFVGGLVRDLSATGVAVLLSSHQIGEVEDMCDRFYVLSRGAVVWEGTAAQMRAQAPASTYRIETSDDTCAFAIARGRGDVRAEISPTGQLMVKADAGTLDPFVLALGDSGIAIRRLEVPLSPLESMFFRLTGEPGTGSGLAPGLSGDTTAQA